MLHSADSLNKRSVQNTKRLAFWSGVWTLSMALATFGPNFLWARESILTILAILLNAGLGIGMILANKRFLQDLDELQRRIQYEAMALALGVGIVGGLSYSLLDITNVIGSDAEIGILVMFISVTYMIGLAIGQARYR